MAERWYDFRVTITVILVIAIFIINNGAQFLLYSNQNVLALSLLGSESAQALAQIRWVIAASLLTSAATMVFWGYFSDKYSKKYILIISSVIWIAACFYIYFDTGITYEGLLISQIFFGLGFGAVWPICYSLLGDIVKPEKRGMVFSVVGLTLGLGMALGLFLGSWFSGWWQFPFFLISLIGSILIVIFLILGTDLKRGAAEHELKKVLEEGAIYTYDIKPEHLRTIWKKPTNVYLFIQGIPGMIP